jgi:predicted O-methyltransferase YrrM
MLPALNGADQNFTAWVRSLLSRPGLTRMGHAQRLDDLNLGLGWLYYALARALRPKTVVVIGSYRGFVPLVMGKALTDNMEGGEVRFIDPSFVDDFWTDATSVQTYFASFGIANVRHFLMTTQQFVESPEYRRLHDIGILFVDGYHSEEQAKFDYEAFRDRMDANGYTLFHDSVDIKTTPVYGPDRSYEHRVKCFIDQLKHQPDLQVFDIPLAAGITLVRRCGP